MDCKTIRFIRRGEVVALGNVPPDRTLLEVLREDLGATGTKEGCGEGDCGACTVVLGEPDGDRLRFRAVNSCIRLAHSIDGLALWTVEDLAGQDGQLHPAQEAMVQCHGSQCGFCTPGFVMSLFGMYQNHVCQGRPVTRALAQEELSGNLCRCTGYRPILDAAQRLAELPGAGVDERAVLAQLSALRTGTRPEPVEGPGHTHPVRPEPVEGPVPAKASTSSARTESDRADGARAGAYLAPETLADLLAARSAHPGAQVVAGCTDVGLWVTKQHRRFGQVLDVTRARELRRIERHADHLAIGAAVPLADAFDALLQDRPGLRTFMNRFAGLPVRNAGTLGGNIANGSPIGDSMPLLIALDAELVLARQGGERTVPLDRFYTGYRRNVLEPDELLVGVRVPRPKRPHPSPQAGEGDGIAGRLAPARHDAAGRLVPAQERHDTAGAKDGAEFLRAYKVSKRFDDDISAICLVVRLELQGGRVARVGIGAGGVAATPVRAARTESFLAGKPWTEDTARQAAQVLRDEFQPITDMRASAEYRREVLGNLVHRFWLESQGREHLRLEQFSLPEVAA